MGAAFWWAIVTRMGSGSATVQATVAARAPSAPADGDVNAASGAVVSSQTLPDANVSLVVDHRIDERQAPAVAAGSGSLVAVRGETRVSGAPSSLQSEQARPASATVAATWRCRLRVAIPDPASPSTHATVTDDPRAGPVERRRANRPAGAAGSTASARVASGVERPWALRPADGDRRGRGAIGRGEDALARTARLRVRSTGPPARTRVREDDARGRPGIDRDAHRRSAAVHTRPDASGPTIAGPLTVRRGTRRTVRSTSRSSARSRTRCCPRHRTR